MAGCVALWRAATATRSSLQLSAYLCLTLVFMGIEATVGLLSGSLTLTTDAAHMLIDCLALLVGLWGETAAHRPPSRSHPFGYGRYETLCGMINAVLLLLVATSVACEALHRLCGMIHADLSHEALHRLAPPPLLTDTRLLPVAIGGLAINILGLAYFHEHLHAAHSGADACGLDCGGGCAFDSGWVGIGRAGGRASGRRAAGRGGGGRRAGLFPARNGSTEWITNGGGKGGDDGKGGGDGGRGARNGAGWMSRLLGSSSGGGGNDNMRGVFLHVLADTMGSVAAIASSFLESRLHWHWADPLCSLLVAACILAVALPLLRDSSTLLLLRLPEELRGSGLRRCLAAVRALPHVREVTHCRVWSHTRSRALGTVCVRADAGASERLITARVSSTMRSFGVHATAVEVQLEDADAPEARQDESSLEDVLAAASTS